MKEYLLFIDGQWRKTVSGHIEENINPANGQAWAKVHLAGPAEVEAALASAQAAQAPWAAALADQKEEVLLKAAALLAEHQEELTEIMIAESGSAWMKAAGEVKASAGVFRVAAGECRRLNTEVMPGQYSGQVSLTLRSPLGVVLGIAPFNYPLILAVKKLAFALAAGNSFILKPSPYTPVIGLKVAEILAAAGLPPGVLQVVPAATAELSNLMVRDPRVAMVSFTGSTKVGRQIAADCGSNLKRCSMELGGKNPLILLEDFDPVQAAEIAAYGAFCHQGQLCMATSRIIAVGQAYDALLPHLVARAQSFKVGDPREKDTIIGPLITPEHCAVIDRQIRDALDKGARLLTGGTHQGSYYEPTVLAEVTPAMDVFYHETFGPVTSVIPAPGIQEALALCNDNLYGLSAAVLTHDLSAAWLLGQQIRAGMVHINDTTYLSATTAPSGGLGWSGLGRSGGHYSMAEYTELKWLTMQTQPRSMPF